jgi:hypothetical protein
LRQPRHVRLEQRGHFLFDPRKEPALRAIMGFFHSI